MVINIKGAIGPAVSDYFVRALENAEKSNAAILILQMDTPGGFDHSMRDIIKNILTSSVPVVSYVSPGGSRAASAGTYILYASHVAAMAPTTNLGAATPIQIGGLPGMSKEEQESPEEKEKEQKENVPKDALERKMVNDAVAYIKALANRHGRNAEWAEKAVREAVSLTAEEALATGVIDLVAVSLEDLLQQVDGRVVVMEGGNKVTLATRDLNITRSDPDWRTKLLAVITDPNVAYILMLLGIYGLIYELANPGFVLPGVVGAICLFLALYSFHILPINYAGLSLIFLGIVFMVAEVFAPSFGALGIGGRYGNGTLQMKGGGGASVHWAGPSIGFDAGANASKVFVLVYHLPNVDALFQRFPALDGSFYFVGGVSANYHQSGDIILAPIRLGAGLRAGVNIGYMKYTRKKTWNPF